MTDRDVGTVDSPGGDGEQPTEGVDPGPSATEDRHPEGVAEAGAEAGEMRSLSPRIQLIWGIWTLVGAAVVGGAAGLAGTGGLDLPIWVGPAVGLAAALLGAVLVRLRYRIWTFQVRPEELYLERGVLTHVRTIAPFVRIQHVDTQRGPLERALGLSTLVVYTAGSRGADVSIPGLEPAEARALQDRLKALAIETEGGDAV